MVEQGARICTLAIWFQPDSRISSHLHPSPCTGSPTHSGLQHEVAAVHVLVSAHGVDHALPNRLPRHSRVSVAPAQRRSGCRGSRLMRGNAHAVHAACERPADPARRGRAQVTARDGFSDLMALALGGSLTDSRGWAVLVLACGSFLQAALGGRLAMSDPFPCKARIVAAAALSSSTGCPVVLVVLVGLHLPEI